jgi:hypothetical protein
VDEISTALALGVCVGGEEKSISPDRSVMLKSFIFRRRRSRKKFFRFARERRRNFLEMRKFSQTQRIFRISPTRSLICLVEGKFLNERKFMKNLCGFVNLLKNFHHDAFMLIISTF